MRILYHHRTLGDGAEGVHIDEMVAAFRSLGHDVQLRGIAAAPGRPGKARFIAATRQAMPRAAFELAAVACNAAEYVRVMADIRCHRPDFLYTRHARSAVGALAAARAACVPSVLEVNCLFSHPQYCQFEPLVLRALAKKLETRAIAYADVVLAVSTPLARQLDELIAGKAVVMPNGADPARFYQRRAAAGGIRGRHGLHGRLTVGWAGIFRDWHGLDVLLDAVAAVPSVSLLLVGEGPVRTAVQQRAVELGVAGRIAMTGRVPHEMMPDYLAAMDIAVVAGDRTGIASPMKLLEYMAMGLPVIAPRLENISDMITHDVNGLLFTPSDSGALASAIERLASNAELRVRLGVQARLTVEQERNWRRNAQRVIEILGQRDEDQLGSGPATLREGAGCG